MDKDENDSDVRLRFVSLIANKYCGYSYKHDERPELFIEKKLKQLNLFMGRKTPRVDWITERQENNVTCHTRIIGGVLCRWWGEGELPPGVRAIDEAAKKLKS